MDAVRGKTKTKKKKKKGAGNKKKVPTMILRGTMRGLTSDEGVDTSIVYNKTVTGGFEVRAADIKTRDNANLPSYDILYYVPGTNAPVSESGVLCDLGTTQFVFENVCPYTLHVRVQRPMGYKQDCGALAMWEAIGSKVMHAIKPKATLTLTSGNNSTSHMVPREVVEKGGRAVHLATISVFREVFSDFGTFAKDLGKETGLTCTVSTRVKTTNGSVGSSNDYVVRLYSGSKRMDHINPMPLPEMRFGDILTSLGAVTSVQSANSGAPTQLRLAFFVGAVEAQNTSLDTNTAYRLPTGVPMYIDTARTKLGIASYMAYHEKEWLVGFFTPKKGVGTFEFYPGVLGPGSPFTSDVSYCPEEWLCPIMGASTKSVVSSKTVSSIMRMSASGKTTLRSEQLDESFLTLLITTVVVIYNVSKVAVETLGAFGVLPAPSKINDAFDMSALTEIG